MSPESHATHRRWPALRGGLIALLDGPLPRLLAALALLAVGACLRCCWANASADPGRPWGRC